MGIKACLPGRQKDILFPTVESIVADVANVRLGTLCNSELLA